MSKEDVPGEKRTTSPGVARLRARSTASASEVAISDLTAPSHERLMLPAISPIRTADLTLSFTRERNRSEEHTSELQSLTNLVCRLLLEKKNAIKSLTNLVCR